MTLTMDNAPVVTDKIKFAKEGGIGWLTFNNPERRNAISMEMWLRIAEVLDDFESDPAIRVVVMQGAGGKAFASGGDISEYDKKRTNAEQAAVFAEMVGKTKLRLDTLSKPLIAMIRGFCIGGGLSVAASADIRIASEDSIFSIPAARLGLGFGFENTRKFVELIGPVHSRDLMLTARKVSAAEALHMGLVNKVVPVGELEQAVRESASQIADNAPLTMRAMKEVLHALSLEPSQRDMKRVDASINACFNSEDYANGRKAFLEKRKPVFLGK